jgi:hypothetical protein
MNVRGQLHAPAELSSVKEAQYREKRLGGPQSCLGTVLANKIVSAPRRNRNLTMIFWVVTACRPVGRYKRSGETDGDIMFSPENGDSMFSFEDGDSMFSS